MADRSNVNVYCRFKPITSSDGEGEHGKINPQFFSFPNGSTVKIIAENQDFIFSKCFPSKTNQPEIFNHVAEPLLEDAMNGYNVAIICYGRTLSGKTFTLEGLDEQNSNDSNHLNGGILPRIIPIIENRIAVDKEHDYSVIMSAINIVNEDIIDLLDINKSKMAILDRDRFPTDIKGLTKRRLKQPNEILSLYYQIKQNRTRISDRYNKQLSRSHHIYLITIKKRSITDDSLLTSQILLADLAGCEKVLKNTRTENLDKNNIDFSLSKLEELISTLPDNPRPKYSESNLTCILRNAIGGNCKTSFILNCLTPKTFIEDTNHTLQFGLSLQNITNQAIVNKILPSSDLQHLLDIVTEQDEIMKIHIENIEKRLESHGDNFAKLNLEKNQTLDDYYRFKDVLDLSNQIFCGDDPALLKQSLDIYKKTCQGLRDELVHCLESLRNLSSSYTELQSQTEKTLKELNELKQSETFSEIPFLKAENQHIRQENDQLKSLCSEYSVEIDNIKKNFKNGGYDNNSLQKEVDSKNKQIKNLTDELTNVINERDSINSAYVTLTQNIDGMSGGKSTDDNYKKLYVQYENLAQQLKTEKQKAFSERNSLLEIQKELQNRINEKEKKYQTEISLLNGNINKLEIDLEKQVQLLAQTNKTMSKDSVVSMAQKLLSDSQNENTLLQKKIVNINREKDGLQEQLDNLIKEKSEHNNSVSNSITEGKSPHSSKSVSKSKKISKNSNVFENNVPIQIKDQIDKLEYDNNRLKDENTKLTNEVGQIKIQITDLLNARDKYYKNVIDINELLSFDNKETAISKINEMNRNLKLENEELHQKLDDLNGITSSISKQLSSSKDSKSRTRSQSSTADNSVLSTPSSSVSQRSIQLSFSQDNLNLINIDKFTNTGLFNKKIFSKKMAMSKDFCTVGCKESGSYYIALDIYLNDGNYYEATFTLAKLEGKAPKIGFVIPPFNNLFETSELVSYIDLDDGSTKYNNNILQKQFNPLKLKNSITVQFDMIKHSLSIVQNKKTIKLFDGISSPIVPIVTIENGGAWHLSVSNINLK